MTTSISRAALAVALLLPACQTSPPPPPVTLVDEAGAPCSGAEKYDADKIIALSQERAAARADFAETYYAKVPVPPKAETASTRIRVNVEASGGHPLASRLTLWKDDTGRWMIADASRDYSAPPPPPEPIFNEAGEIIGAEVYDPDEPRIGPMNAERAAQLDEILTSKCFIDGPDTTPRDMPLRAPEDPRLPTEMCPPDSSGYGAELIQEGQPTRYLAMSCYSPFVLSGFLTLVTYAKPVLVEDPA